MINKKLLAKMYKKGITLHNIGLFFDLSPQRIRKILYDLNIDRKRYWKSKAKLSKSEQFVFNKLKNLGLNVSASNTNDKFDLLVNNHILIEVKYRSKSRKFKNSSVLSYSIGLNNFFFNFLIVVLGEINNPTCYVMPLEVCNKNMTFPLTPKNKTNRQQYKEAWYLIKNAGATE